MHFIQTQRQIKNILVQKQISFVSLIQCQEHKFFLKENLNLNIIKKDNVKKQVVN